MIRMAVRKEAGPQKAAVMVSMQRTKGSEKR